MQNNIAVELIVLEIQLKHLNLPTYIQVYFQFNLASATATWKQIQLF